MHLVSPEDNHDMILWFVPWILQTDLVMKQLTSKLYAGSTV